MDLFKFTPVSVDTTLDQGERINYVDRVTWIERYNTPGEFTLEAKLSSGLRELLPLGTLISHMDTTEVMVVEDQQIKETHDDTSLIITGRSFVSFLENRLVGMNLARASSVVTPYTVTADYSWNQIVKVINDHIVNPPTDTNDSITNLVATHSMSGTGISEDRSIPYGDLLKNVTDLLKIDNLGVRTIRRNTFGAPSGSSTQSVINIYQGVDKTSKVMFSWVAGDIEEAEYLFTNRGHKTTALVIGQYIWAVVDGAGSRYSRRMMIVDGTDIDGHLGEVPTAPWDGITHAVMSARGRQELAAQKQVSITRVDVSDNSTHMYRRDYGLGDLVAIDGNYGQIAVMRVTEYAEIEDETGKTGHPTLTLPGA